MLSVRALLSCAALLQGTYAASWTYTGPHGATNWPKSFPICGKKSQSPIDIQEDDVLVDSKIGPIRFTNYDTPIGGLTMINNGHSAISIVSHERTCLAQLAEEEEETIPVHFDQLCRALTATVYVTQLSAISLTIPAEAEVTIEGGGLPSPTYKAFQLHFHWGEDDSVGSEHLFSGRTFPMELHIVHFNTKYPHPGVAVEQPDGLAVLGFMYEVTEEDNVNYAPIVDALSLVTFLGDYIDIPPVSLDSLVPDRAEFYRYSGSLTTPACFESVTWTVLKQPIPISGRQLELFRSLLDSHGAILTNNFRPVQPLNGRQVIANFDPAVRQNSLFLKNLDCLNSDKDNEATPIDDQSPIRFLFKNKAYLADSDDLELNEEDAEED